MNPRAPDPDPDPASFEDNLKTIDIKTFLQRHRHLDDDETVPLLTEEDLYRDQQSQVQQ